VQEAARSLGVQIFVLNAGTENEIDAAFTKLVEQRAGALMLVSDTFFTSQRSHLATLSTYLRIPTLDAVREFTEAGGLVSYGSSLAGVYRQAGVYAGRILKGDKPSELPVQLPTAFELVINLKTAKALGLDVPATLLARADEVIAPTGVTYWACACDRPRVLLRSRASACALCGGGRRGRLRWPRGRRLRWPWGQHGATHSTHSITSSARSRIEVGNVTPIALAALRLTTNSNLVGC